MRVIFVESVDFSNRLLVPLAKYEGPRQIFLAPVAFRVLVDLQK